MTIDEAIKQEKEFALKCRKSVEIAICENKKYDSDNISSLMIYETIQENKDTIEMYTRKAEYHEQLAEWLEELKEAKQGFNENRKAGYKHGLKAGYTKAIQDFTEKIQWEYLNSCGIKQQEIDFLITVSSQVAEQLKEGGVE